MTLTRQGAASVATGTIVGVYRWPIVAATDQSRSLRNGRFDVRGECAAGVKSALVVHVSEVYFYG